MIPFAMLPEAIRRDRIAEYSAARTKEMTETRDALCRTLCGLAGAGPFTEAAQAQLKRALLRYHGGRAWDTGLHPIMTTLWAAASAFAAAASLPVRTGTIVPTMQPRFGDADTYAAALHAAHAEVLRGRLPVADWEKLHAAVRAALRGTLAPNDESHALYEALLGSMYGDCGFDAFGAMHDAVEATMLLLCASVVVRDGGRVEKFSAALQMMGSALPVTSTHMAIPALGRVAFLSIC